MAETTSSDAREAKHKPKVIPPEILLPFILVTDRFTSWRLADAMTRLTGSIVYMMCSE
jgi:hypothetical protein